MERYYNFLLKIKLKVFFIGMLCIATYSGLISQSLSCEELLLKEFPIHDGLDSEKESDLLTLHRCGHDLTAVPSELIGMALMKISLEGKDITYGDLVSAIDSIENDPAFKNAKQKAFVVIAFKLIISLLALSLLIYWGRIFFLQIKSKDKLDDILDKME